MNFKKEIRCPHCNNVNKIDLKDYIQSTDSSEREMGIETEYTILCEEICDQCNSGYLVTGSLWEYPEGSLNLDDTSVEKL